MRSTSVSARRPQEVYTRSREDPFFNGILRSEYQSPASFLGSTGNRNMGRSISDIGIPIYEDGPSFVPENVVNMQLEGSISDMIFESMEYSSAKRHSNVLDRRLSNVSDTRLSNASDRRLSNASDIMPLTPLRVQTDWNLYLKHGKDLRIDYSPSKSEAGEIYVTKEKPQRPSVEKSYRVTRMKEDQSSTSPYRSAASYFSGYSAKMEIIESCESVNKLNEYLRESRSDANAGIPGKYLHAVMGGETADVGNLVSTIMYAFYLNDAIEDDQLCTVPVINMKRADLRSHAELRWLLDSCQIDQSSLIFIDEIDLPYYNLYGGLKLVLLNSNKVPTKQEELKEAVVEIFNARKGESVYPWVDAVTIGEDCSCCAVIAEKFLQKSPEILRGQGFSRLLLASILLDTANLTMAECSSRDKYMVTLLLNGAGRYGSNGLFHILKRKMYSDLSPLKVTDLLRKDFKKWTGRGSRSGTTIGMSSIGIPMWQLLSHKETSAQEIKYFQYIEKAQLLIVVSGYHDTQKNFKREILVSAESMKLMRNVLLFFNSNSSLLSLRILEHPGLVENMKAFEMDKFTSRKAIELLLEEFAGIIARG